MGAKGRVGSRDVYYDLILGSRNGMTHAELAGALGVTMAAARTSCAALIKDGRLVSTGNKRGFRLGEHVRYGLVFDVKNRAELPARPYSLPTDPPPDESIGSWVGAATTAVVKGKKEVAMPPRMAFAAIRVILDTLEKYVLNSPSPDFDSEVRKFVEESLKSRSRG